MPRSRKTSNTGTPWYEQWWAGEDLDAVAQQDAARGRDASRAERAEARRWAARQRPRGGLLRRLLG